MTPEKTWTRTCERASEREGALFAGESPAPTALFYHDLSITGSLTKGRVPCLLRIGSSRRARRRFSRNEVAAALRSRDRFSRCRDDKPPERAIFFRKLAVPLIPRILSRAGTVTRVDGSVRVCMSADSFIRESLDLMSHRCEYIRKYK